MTQTVQTLKQQLQSFDNFELVPQQESHAFIESHFAYASTNRKNGEPIKLLSSIKQGIS